jgi:hypothetical protein
MNINDLVQKVIPPSTREHREGFSNESILKGLSEDEKYLLEEELIKKLESQVEDKSSIDALIVETLSRVGSSKSMDILFKVLHSGVNNFDKIITAQTIYQLSGDEEMINVAINAFLKIDNKEVDPHYIYTLISAFYRMAKFDTERTTAVVEKYMDHNEYLVSYNAKRALGYI